MARLLEYNFDDTLLVTNQGEIQLHKTDLLSADGITKLTPRIRGYINILSRHNYLGTFLSKKSISKEEQRHIASILDIPESDIRSFRNYLIHQTDDLFESRILDIEKKLDAIKLGRVLYLPTYRRIEKDLKSIFPDIEDRFKSRLTENQITARQGLNFQEIVSFGMDDIKSLISGFTSSLDKLAKTKSNDAAQEYIRDMVRGSIKDYSIGPIRGIDSEIIKEFVARLDDQLLSKEDKAQLTKQIDALRAKKRGKPQKDMQYLGFFVEKMLGVYMQMKTEEYPFIEFTKVIKKYLGSNKDIEYRDYSFSIKDRRTGSFIGLDDLSSGEKQIISFFSYLLLKPGNNNILLIDEPELSLSVPWQKTFLPDLLNTGRCSYIFSVTHSPFVFDNEFRPFIVDVRKLLV